ncbi:hypothetical protein EDD37DRAFT_626890 [Exophiala viscosa]|nr:hypothetical protein EDD37DRAFT_626890 [Exophiala viscosa]
MYHFRNGPANNECFVEYVLEARVTEAEDLHRTRSPKVNKSTYPIVFHPSSTPKPIEEYNLLTKNQLFSITTMRLLPQYTGTMLRIRDRARSIFRPRSMPRFSFILTVQSPTIIQLFHPDPIPFLISVTLDPSSENRNIAEPYPEIVLRSLKVDLRSWVGYRADQYSELTWASTPIHACNMLNQVLAPTEDGGAPLNIGTLYNFRLGNAILGSQADSQLYPTFTSYDIVRKYLLT